MHLLIDLLHLLNVSRMFGERQNPAHSVHVYVLVTFFLPQWPCRQKKPQISVHVNAATWERSQSVFCYSCL